MPTLGLDREFLNDFGRLPRPVQTKVADAFTKFGEATHTGMHLEKIAGVRDPRLRSIRIDQYWRGIVLAPEGGDSYLLLTVRGHDEAYEWAKRRQVSVNAALGALEVRDATGLDDALPSLAARAETAPVRLFDHVGDADLGRLGIDDQVRTFARALTTDEQLDAARPMLPEPQYDVLVALAAGLSPDEVWDELAAVILPAEEIDRDDVTAALGRSTGRIVVVDGPDELMEAFSYPFALWRIFLHPSQRRVAYGSFNGPARVSGGPGTGKTVVALHRAKHLAASSGGDRSVLLTTFTRTLAASLDEGLRLLVDDDELLRAVDVRSIDRIAYHLVASAHGRPDVLSEAEELTRWRAALDSAGGGPLGETALRHEWRNVVLAQDIQTRDGYLAASRAGRGRRLGTDQRREVWAAVEAFTRLLAEGRRWTYETICAEAARLLAARDPRPYRHIVVDEAQDLSPWHWRLLRAAVAPGRDDLFLAGDTHQRIYDNRVSLRAVGIDIAGRSSRLTINYRTTAEILGWSLGLLGAEGFDDMAGARETLRAFRSEVHGPAPMLRGHPERAEELAGLVSTVRGWLADGVEPEQIGIVARTSSLVKSASGALTAAGVAATALTQDAPPADRVAVGTMHRVKGLEFRCVAVVGVEDGQVPAGAAVTPAEEDRRTHELDTQRERCVLFVACTRAREQLAVSWSGRPSPFLPT